MFVAVVVALVILLFLIAFLAPRRSRRAQQGADRAFEAGERGALRAPGRLGEILEKPVEESKKAVDKSADAGRRSRFKLPF